VNIRGFGSPYPLLLKLSIMNLYKSIMSIVGWVCLGVIAMSALLCSCNNDEPVKQPESKYKAGDTIIYFSDSSGNIIEYHGGDTTIVTKGVRIKVSGSDNHIRIKQ
jgi:hypothetical protein